MWQLTPYDNMPINDQLFWTLNWTVFLIVYLFIFIWEMTVEITFIYYYYFNFFCTKKIFFNLANIQ